MNRWSALSLSPKLLIVLSKRLEQLNELSKIRFQLPFVGIAWFSDLKLIIECFRVHNSALQDFRGLQIMYPIHQNHQVLLCHKLLLCQCGECASMTRFDHASKHMVRVLDQGVVIVCCIPKLN